MTLNCSRTASILLATRYPLDERHFLSVETVRMYCRYLLLVLVQRAFYPDRTDPGISGPVERHAQSSRPFLRPRGLVDAALAAQVGFVRFGGLYHLDAGVGFEWLVARVDCPVLSVGFRHRRMVPGDPLEKCGGSLRVFRLVGIRPHPFKQCGLRRGAQFFADVLCINKSWIEKGDLQ